MLWQKEESKDAVYMDIFGPKCSTKVHKKANDEIAACKGEKKWQKNDEHARNELNLGINLLELKDYLNAIECFNKCLCFAEIDAEIQSDIHGAAFAKRAICFYHLKMYDKCLIDIELAKKANCPRNLMKILNQRIDECKKFINGGNLVQTNGPVLSYEPNPQLPILANVVNIETTPGSADGQKRIIANENLKVGDTIFVEPCDFGETHAAKYKNCAICFNNDNNLIPCGNCTAAMFCYGKCQENSFHEIECTVKPFEILTDNTAINFRLPLIRSMLMAIQLFPSVDELIQFVEETVSMTPSDMPEITSDAKSKYRAFLQSPAVPVCRPYLPLVFSIFKTFLNQDGIADMFKSKKYRRFLAHLMVKHFLVLEKNAIICFRLYNVIGEPKKQVKKVIALYMSIWKDLFNHSCTPNIGFQLRNGSIVGFVLRPIEKGEELFYTVEEKMPESYVQRRAFLQNHLQIDCKCELCTSGADKAPMNSVISSDPEYQFIQECERDAFDGKLSTQAFDMAKEHCESVLEKYGRLPWCKEIKYIIMIYHILLTECSPFTSNAQNTKAV